MKTLEITKEIAQDILSTVENNTYIVWWNDSEITESELMNEFHLIENNNTITLEHNVDDYRVEDIVLTNRY